MEKNKNKLKEWTPILVVIGILYLALCIWMFFVFYDLVLWKRLLASVISPIAISIVLILIGILEAIGHPQWMAQEKAQERVCRRKQKRKRKPKETTQE
jgi:CHASE1-domain containing sensor protein